MVIVRVVPRQYVLKLCTWRMFSLPVRLTHSLHALRLCFKSLCCCKQRAALARRVCKAPGEAEAEQEGTGCALQGLWDARAAPPPALPLSGLWASHAAF